MDLHTTKTSQPKLRAAGPRRLRNVFEDFFDARRSQLICSAEIALPILMSWDLLVVDKPADARSRCDKSTEQILTEITRPCPRCFVLMRRAGGCVHMKCDNPRCQREFCCFCQHELCWLWYDASFCIGSVEASHLEVLASVEKQTRSYWAQQAHDAEDTYAEEILQRFRAALTTRLESNEELFLAEVADALLRWRRFLEFYNHRETRIRVNAQVVFADVVDSSLIARTGAHGIQACPSPTELDPSSSPLPATTPLLTTPPRLARLKYERHSSCAAYASSAYHITLVSDRAALPMVIQSGHIKGLKLRSGVLSRHVIPELCGKRSNTPPSRRCSHNGNQHFFNQHFAEGRLTFPVSIHRREVDDDLTLHSLCFSYFQHLAIWHSIVGDKKTTRLPTSLSALTRQSFCSTLHLQRPRHQGTRSSLQQAHPQE